MKQNQSMAQRLRELKKGAIMRVSNHQERMACHQAALRDGILIQTRKVLGGRGEFDVLRK